MCGIAGFVHTRFAPSVLDRMLDALRRRGPDGEGRYFGRLGAWHLALGHRRLAIIDLDGGAQPMWTADRQSVITYNGEIYNFPQLRTALEHGGVQFSNRSDTEVVLNHLTAHGEAGLADLNGMFALALWRADGRLLLARDRIGIKPLYWAPLPDGGIAFASELTALLCHPELGRRLSRPGLLSYLFSDYAHPPHTLIEGVHKLPAAHALVWQGGRVQVTPYWSLPAEPKPASGQVPEVWSLLEQAVERQLVSDVPVGVLLSGGIDSSSVALLAQRHTTRPIATFTIGFSDDGFDETPYAAAMAHFIGSEHHHEVLDAAKLFELLDEALAHLDEPLADHSYLPTYLLARLASRHVKVVLGGDGGDELWGGYPTYWAHWAARLYTFLPRGMRRWLAEYVAPRLPTGDRYQDWAWRVRHFTRGWNDDAQRRHLRWMASLDLPELWQVLPSLRDQLPATLAEQSLGWRDAVGQAMALDLRTYLPGSVLTKVDRAAMAHGLEVRPPFLDLAMIDAALATPANHKVGWQSGKLLLKRAAADHLPAEIVSRPKRGFGMPVTAWIRGPLAGRVEDALADSPLWDGDLLQRQVFSAWQADHVARRADHGKVLWALIVLDAWTKRHGVKP